VCVCVCVCIYIYIYIRDNNKVIKNRLDNYLIPPTNGRLMNVNPKLYTKCPPWGLSKQDQRRGDQINQVWNKGYTLCDFKEL
jgi:hypothetical protein